MKSLDHDTILLLPRSLSPKEINRELLVERMPMEQFGQMITTPSMDYQEKSLIDYLEAQKVGTTTHGPQT